MFFFRLLFSCNFHDQYWAQMFTALWFFTHLYALCWDTPRRILVFDNYQNQMYTHPAFICMLGYTKLRILVFDNQRVYLAFKYKLTSLRPPDEYLWATTTYRTAFNIGWSSTERAPSEIWDLFQMQTLKCDSHARCIYNETREISKYLLCRYSLW